MQEKIENNLDKVKTRIKQANERIDNLQKNAENLPTKLQDEAFSVINNLKIKKAKMEENLDIFMRNSANAYIDVRTGLEIAWEDLNMAYDSAKERFDSITS